MKIFGKQILDWKQLNQVAESKRAEKILEAISVGLKSLSATPLAMVSAEKFVGRDALLMGSAPPVIMTGSDTVDQPDRGYEALFGLVDMTNSSNDTFELTNVTGGVTFYQQFQSSPAPWDGRYADHRHRNPLVRPVSILARPVGRALRCKA